MWPLRRRCTAAAVGLAQEKPNRIPLRIPPLPPHATETHPVAPGNGGKGMSGMLTLAMATAAIAEARILRESIFFFLRRLRPVRGKV